MKLYDQTGQSLGQIEGDAGEGGEGKVCRLDAFQAECVKLYHPHILETNQELRLKIGAMVRNPPADPVWQSQGYRSLAWPSREVYSDPEQKKFVGFTMPFIDPQEYLPSYKFYQSEERARSGLAFNWEYLLTAAGNLASVIAALHAKGHCVGDLRETNVLVSRRALVALVDCDSFQVHDPGSNQTYFTRVGTGEYLPPELFHADFGANNIDRYHADLFALSALIFKFLMEGFHPFQGVGKALNDAPSREEKILKGIFPYSSRNKSYRVQPHPKAPPYKIIPPKLQAAFERCFVDGHREPGHRPPAAEWYFLLKAELGHIKECGKDAGHRYSGHLRKCPWCELNAKTLSAKARTRPPSAGPQTAVKSFGAPPAPQAPTYVFPPAPASASFMTRVAQSMKSLMSCSAVLLAVGLILGLSVYFAKDLWKKISPPGPAAELPATPMPPGPNADRAQLYSLLQQWVTAWENTPDSMAAYRDFYDDSFSANYPGRPLMGKGKWMSDKEKKARQAGCMVVGVSQVDIQLNQDEAAAVFYQKYIGADHCDQGWKTLNWKKRGAAWKIAGENMPSSEPCPERCRP